MGLRDRLKSLVERFSGEHSAAAPSELKPYERPGKPVDKPNVVRARLTRPREQDDGSEEPKPDQAEG